MIITKKIKTFIVLFVTMGVLFFGYHSISYEAYTKPGSSKVKVVKKSVETNLKTVLSMMFSTPDKKYNKFFKIPVEPVTTGSAVSPSNSSGGYDSMVKKDYGKYFTDDCLDSLKGNYLNAFQGFAIMNHKKMSPKKIVISKDSNNSRYDFTVTVAYGNDLKDKKFKTAKVTGYAYCYDGKKICLFSIKSDGGLDAGLRSLTHNLKM